VTAVYARSYRPNSSFCLYSLVFIYNDADRNPAFIATVALTTLSLVTDKDKATNMCVMLWAYIDERDGRLLEAGLERTIISSPRMLSFADATVLLDGDASPGSMSNTRGILSVAKRNLSLWGQRHNQRNQAAQKHRYCCPYW
jgi:hypothetical protein